MSNINPKRTSPRFSNFNNLSISRTESSIGNTVRNCNIVSTDNTNSTAIKDINSHSPIRLVKRTACELIATSTELESAPVHQLDFDFNGTNTGDGNSALFHIKKLDLLYQTLEERVSKLEKFVADSSSNSKNQLSFVLKDFNLIDNDNNSPASKFLSTDSDNKLMKKNETTREISVII